MKNNKWDVRFLNLAKHVSTWSKDPSTKVGAVIVDIYKRVVSVGFNGYPRGIPDNGLENREEKYAKVLHAEINAILFSQRSLEGCTIYVYPMAPCSQCASTIVQSGITRVVTVRPTDKLIERWGEKIKIAEDIIKDSGGYIDYFNI